MGGWTDSGGGSTTTTQKWEPPEWTQPGWQTLVQGATQLATRPYQPFDGMRVAPINGYQTQGMNFLEDRALYGAPDINAARGMSMNMSQGNYANPWAGNVSGISQGFAYNPWAGKADAMLRQSDPYSTDAYTQGILANVRDQMTQAHMTGAAPQIDAMASEGNGWGGGGWKAMQLAGLSNLDKQVGQASTQILEDQQRFKSGTYQADMNRALQAIGMGSGMYQGDVANQLQATQLGGGLYGQDIAAMLQGGALAGQLSQDDWTSGKALMDIGNLQNSYVQKLLDSQYQEWLAAQQYPAQQLDILKTGLGAASGAFGSSFASQTLPSMSPVTALAGLGSLGYGMGLFG